MTIRTRAAMTATAILVACLLGMANAHAQTPPLTTIRVGWCAKTLSSASAPYAIATKMGWFSEAGIKVDVVPLPGSGDCAKYVATKELPFSLPSPEPVAVLYEQGVKAKYFYTAYQTSVYGMAVPADSPIKTVADLKGKKIGVISMAAASTLIAKALATDAGLNADKDITIVVAGEGAQTAALLRSNQIDALSQFDTQYALVENAGVKLRRLSHPQIEKFPSNAFFALDETIRDKRREAIGLAKGYAMGTIFALANPEAAVRILWEVYPQTKATGKDEATALRDDISTLKARSGSWLLEPAGAMRWGDNVEANHQAYLDWLQKQGIVKNRVPAKDILTDDLLAEINTFDAAAITARAKAYSTK